MPQTVHYCQLHDKSHTITHLGSKLSLTYPYVCCICISSIPACAAHCWHQRLFTILSNCLGCCANTLYSSLSLFFFFLCNEVKDFSLMLVLIKKLYFHFLLISIFYKSDSGCLVYVFNSFIRFYCPREKFSNPLLLLYDKHYRG